MVWQNKTDKEIKDKMRELCDVLEVDHLGLINESLEGLAKRFNEVNK